MKYFFFDVYSCQNYSEILYKRLANREHNISHKEMPSFSDHVDFVESRPYREWFFIKYNEDYVGTFYIQKNNSIGINLDEFHYKQGILETLKYINKKFIPREAIKSIVPEQFYINLPYEDKKFQEVLTKYGYNPIQLSYRI